MQLFCYGNEYILWFSIYFVMQQSTETKTEKYSMADVNNPRQHNMKGSLYAHVTTTVDKQFEGCKDKD